METQYVSRRSLETQLTILALQNSTGQLETGVTIAGGSSSLGPPAAEALLV